MTKDLTEQYEVGGTPICKEGSYVYTENGIEKVHYCQVGCITERVTPKSNILAPVPSYDHFVELTEKDKENAKLKELLKDLIDEAEGALQAIQKDCESDDWSVFNYPEVQYFYNLKDKIDEVLK